MVVLLPRLLTDSNGDYLFVELPVGVYSVVETNLAGYSDVSDVDGIHDNSIGVSLTFTNLNSTKNDFVDELPGSATGVPSGAPVEVVLGSISGNVKEDTDDDGIGEAPIFGVLMTLLDSSNIVVATTLTDINGNYKFVDLPVGSYTVKETNPSTHGDASEVDGTNDNMLTAILTTSDKNSTENNFV